MIILPDRPAPADATPMYFDKGEMLPGGGGASDQKVMKLGDRFGIAVEMPSMASEKVGRQWVARLIQGKAIGARMLWPLQGFKPGSPGSVSIAGSGQAGMTLLVDGGTPNYAGREGQFFHIETSGRRFLYMLTAQVLFDNSGSGALPVWPPLRFEHLDNDVVELGRPTIEGFVQGDAASWNYAIAHRTNLAFELHERA